MGQAVAQVLVGPVDQQADWRSAAGQVVRVGSDRADPAVGRVVRVVAREDLDPV